jgi:hypothetical protein
MIKIDDRLELRVNDDNVSSNIFGYQNSSNLLVLVPGTLYDTEKPPEHCILRSVQEKLADKSLSLMVNRTRRFGNDLYEITPSEYAKRIETALDIVVSSYHTIDSISYVSHSTGALTLGHLFDKNSKSKNLLLTPPSPTKSVVEQVKRCTYDLMPVSIEASNPSQIAYRSREGFDCYFGDEIWDDINTLEPAYMNLCKQDSHTGIIFATKDRVFPFSDEDIKLFHNAIKVEDTHSLKNPESLKIISDYIITEMLI